MPVLLLVTTPINKCCEDTVCECLAWAEHFLSAGMPTANTGLDTLYIAAFGGRQVFDWLNEVPSADAMPRTTLSIRNCFQTQLAQKNRHFGLQQLKLETTKGTRSKSLFTVGHRLWQYHSMTWNMLAMHNAHSTTFWHVPGLSIWWPVSLAVQYGHVRQCTANCHNNRGKGRVPS